MLFRDLIAYLSIIVILALAVLIVVGVNMYTALKPERYFSTVTPRNFGLDYRPITLKTADGVSIAGWHIPSQDGPAAAAIVALHGYPADKGDLLAHTVFLADTFDLLLIDFRYFGESGGDFSTVGAREVAEYEAAVTYLRDLGFEKVGVYGFSMGGAVALMGAAGPVRADAVVAEAAYQDLYTMAEETFRNLGPLKRPLGWLMRQAVRLVLDIDLKEVSPAKAASALDIPVLIIHSRQDQVVPFGSALAIQGALQHNDQAEFMFTDAVTHGEVSRDFATTLRDFFSRHLLR